MRRTLEGPESPAQAWHTVHEMDQILFKKAKVTLLGCAAGPADKHWTSWSWSNHSSLIEFLYETHSGGAWEPSTWNGPILVYKSQISFHLLWLQVCGQSVDKFGYWLQGLFRHFAGKCFLDFINNQSIIIERVRKAGFFTIPLHQNIHIYLEANGKCLKSSLWTRFSRESFSFLLMIISLMWCDAKEICFEQNLPFHNSSSETFTSGSNFHFLNYFHHHWCVLNKILHFWPIVDWYVRAVVCSPLL